MIPLQSAHRPEQGTHVCLVCDSDERRAAAVTGFVRDGLATRERVWYLADAQTTDEAVELLCRGGVPVDRFLASGQLRVATAESSYLTQSPFEPSTMIAALKDAIDDALDHGYAGFRVTGEMSWASRKVPGSEHLLEYEARVGPEALYGRPARTLCQYDSRLMDPATFPAYASVHSTVTGGDAVFADPLLRISPLAQGPGLALYGECDVSNVALVRRALAPLLRNPADVHLDLSGLEFIDVTVASELIAASQRLWPDRRLVLHSPPRTLRRMLAAHVWAPLPSTLEVTSDALV